MSRGEIVRIKLKKSIVFNSNTITKAIIEIDHINYGIDKKTKTLNKNKRTNFTVATAYKGRVSQFDIRINCPVKCRFFGKQFIMFFDTHFDKSDEIHTLTIFPGW